MKLGKCPEGSKKEWCKKLTQDEANCFWMNFPKQALDFQKFGVDLNPTNASFAWNYAANGEAAKPVLMKITCD